MTHAHYAAVHAIPSEFYSDEVKEAWSRKPDEARYQWMRQVVTLGEELVVVAEDACGVQGFGIVSPASCQLRALYVHPAVCSRGIGRALLQELESRTRGLGIKMLQLNASLNAERFYQRNGYESLMRDSFALSSDYEMACVKMEKDLRS